MMRFTEEELITIKSVLTIAKQQTEMHERPSKSDNLKNYEYRKIIRKIEDYIYETY